MAASACKLRGDMKIPVGWELPDEFRSRLGEKLGRQRAMIAQGQLLLILHALPTQKSLSREEVAFWRDAEGQWKSTGGKGGLGALRAHLESYAKAVADLERDYESAHDSHGYFAVLEAVVPLARAAHNQFLALQSAREGVPEATEIIALRDLAGDVERASAIIQIDAKNALDYQIARQSEEQARLANELMSASYRLSFIAALFLPLTAITTVFGMTLRSGLENAPPSVFWSIFGFGALLGAIFGIFVQKRAPKIRG